MARLEINRTRLLTLTSDIRNFIENRRYPDSAELLSRCAARGDLIIQQCEVNKIDHDDVVSEFVQLLLDYSYAVETDLVDNEFSCSSAADSIQQIFGLLDEGIAALQNPNLSASARTTDLKECIYWRKGALLYMYCHTAINSPQRLLVSREQKDLFIQYCAKGYEALRSLFDVRSAESAVEYESSSQDTLELVKQGVLSDTHMLALMYGGELCYWYDSHGGNHVEFDAKKAGCQFLQKYIKLANGLLKHAQWDINTASMLIDFWCSPAHHAVN